MAAVGTGDLATEARCGKHLAGITEVGWVEGTTHELHRVQIVRAEHLRHVTSLVGTDTMLAGDRSAGVEAVGQDLVSHLLGQLRLTLDTFVVADQRVQIAVAGMEDIPDLQARLDFEGPDAAQHSGKLGSRNHPVLHVVVRRDAAHRRERRLASLPDPLALACIPRHLNVARTSVLTDLLDQAEQLRDFRLRSVELDDEHGVGLGEVWMHGGLHSLDGESIHHLDRRRDDARGDDVGHGVASSLAGIERREQCLHRFRLAQEAQRHLGHDRQGPFRADHHPEQVESRCVVCRPTHVNQLSVRKDRLECQDVVHRESVLEAVGATGVLGHVAANGADDLARGIRRVVVAKRRDLAADVEVHDAWLDRDPLVGDVDGENLVEACEHDQHAVGDRQRATRQAGPMTASHERDSRSVAEAHHLLNFRGGIRQHRDASPRA